MSEVLDVIKKNLGKDVVVEFNTPIGQDTRSGLLCLVPNGFDGKGHLPFIELDQSFDKLVMVKSITKIETKTGEVLYSQEAQK